MFTILTSTAVSTLSGALAGSAAGWWAARRLVARSAAFDDLGVDPDLDEQITQAARQWATQHGQPGAAPFVADKLRLMHGLQRGRSRRRRRWSR